MWNLLVSYVYILSYVGDITGLVIFGIIMVNITLTDILEKSLAIGRFNITITIT